MTKTSTYQGASPEAIQHHYDVGNEFFALWLDPTLSYSSALWVGAADVLVAAQKRKLDHMATATRAVEAGRVLDIGCGWGCMVQRLTDMHGVDRAVGLTLSEAQADHLRRRGNPQVEVRVENWLDHQPEIGYDAIVSFGAFEHFADMGMTREQRVDAYREFFARCAQWLPIGARLGLETIIKGNNTKMSRRTVRDLLFIIDTVFPESELPWLSEIMEASERLFDPLSVDNRPDDYARTCREWHDRLAAQRDRATELAGSPTVTAYERYLDASAEVFDNRHAGLARIIFERV